MVVKPAPSNAPSGSCSVIAAATAFASRLGVMVACAGPASTSAASAPPSAERRAGDGRIAASLFACGPDGKPVTLTPVRWASRNRFAPLVSLLVAVAVAGAWIGLQAAGALSVLELDTVDSRFEVREGSPPKDVAFVAVDDVTFDDLQARWPFRRSLHAQVIDRLTKAGARAIAYDVQFTEPTKVAEDNALIEAVDRSPRIVLATTAVDE